MHLDIGVYVFILHLLDKVTNQWFELRKLQRSNDLLTEYNDWRDGLNVDAMSKLEYAEYEHERNAVLELLKKGKNVDAILKRRLKRARAKRRKDTRHS